MKLKPLADNVVMKQVAAEEKTSGGIFLTSAAQEKPEIYEIIIPDSTGEAKINSVSQFLR